MPAEFAGLTGDDLYISVRLSHVQAVPESIERPVLVADDFARTLAPLCVSDACAQMPRDAVALSRALTVGRGLRLPADFGRARLPVDEAYVRYPAWEDLRLAAMTDEASYRADFLARIEPSDWRAPQHIAFRQLNQVRLAKYFTNWYEFDGGIQQAADLRRFAQQLTGQDGQTENPQLLILNNPENPLTLAAYENNDWYRGYIRFLSSLAQDSQGRLFFADHRSQLPANAFLDTHHLTYDGMRTMAPVYARRIAEVLH